VTFPAYAVGNDEILKIGNLAHKLLAVGTPFQQYNSAS
jgi:hypothetical protein